VPRLWDATIDGHRRTVHAAILDTAAALVAERGLAGVTMSQIAQRAGIGRATLYKYFPDVEAIVLAWHERQVADHLRRLNDVAEAVPDPGERLRSVLQSYAELSAGQHADAHGMGHTPDLAAPLHRAEHVHTARQRLHALITEIITAAAETGTVRTDVPAAELAAYCLHALGAAATTHSNAARQRLVTVILAGLARDAS
jgi:AcrR family transcriptional regulator